MSTIYELETSLAAIYAKENKLREELQGVISEKEKLFQEIKDYYNSSNPFYKVEGYIGNSKVPASVRFGHTRVGWRATKEHSFALLGLPYFIFKGCEEPYYAPKHFDTVKVFDITGHNSLANENLYDRDELCILTLDTSNPMLYTNHGEQIKSILEQNLPGLYEDPRKYNIRW